MNFFIEKQKGVYLNFQIMLAYIHSICFIGTIIII